MILLNYFYHKKKIKYANDNLRYIELDLDENFEIVLGRNNIRQKNWFK